MADYQKRLQAFYNIIANDPKKSTQPLFPAEANTKPNTRVAPENKAQSYKALRAINFPSDVQKFYTWWLSENFDSSHTIRERFNRYEDLKFMRINAPIISLAVDLFADEAIQYDSQSKVINVHSSDKKVTKSIYNFLDKMGYLNPANLRNIAVNLAQYGDSFAINTTEDKKGVTAVTFVDVFDIKDRLEFKLSNVKSEYNRINGTYQTYSRSQRLQKLANLMNAEADNIDSDVGKYFQTYLFGYQVDDDLFLPPWNVSHFRLFSTESEFFPWGKSLFINSISPFRQLQSAKNLMVMARASKFPKEHIEVQTTDKMTAIEKWNAVLEAKQEYQNLTVELGQKEDFGLSSQLWTPAELLKFNLIENKMNIDDIADVEFLLEEMLSGTGIPRSYIKPESGFGESGQALMQKHKPFARKTLSIQSAILNEITHLIKLHWLITGEYDPYVTPFELTMNFPVIEDTNDRIRNRGDSIDLAKSIVDNMADILGIDTVDIPEDMIVDIFDKYSVLNSDELSSWFKSINIKRKKTQEYEEKDNRNKRTIKNEKKLASIRETINSPKLMEDIYFKSVSDLHLTEGVMCGKHYMTSLSETLEQKRIYDVFRTEKLNG